jgi:hypothetical protein
VAAACTIPAAAAPAKAAGPEIKEETKLKLAGDVRFRAESDWNSRQADGTERADRDRLRFRFRLGFTYTIDEHYSFGGRIRSGVSQDQQSPHTTLGDEFETKPVNIDKAYLQGSWKYGWVWGGKNAFTFWTQNELLWDEDVTPEGVAGGGNYRFGQSHWRLKPVLGYFILETAVVSDQIDEKSDLVAAQLALEASYAKVDLAFAADSYSFYDNPDTTDVALADLDYQIWHGGAKAAFKTAWKPWSIGFDYMKNTEDYPDTLFNGDKKTGYVAGLNLGRLKEKKDWLVAYYYAHIEKYAIVARLGQDDWLRWGSATDTRSSNFEGHEFRFAYAIRPNFNVMLRVYLVKGIVLETPTAVDLEDGKRARLDFNMSF